MQDDNQVDIAINYEKSRYFRVIHADGAFGGAAPNGYLHISFYNERNPLPTKSALTVTKDGSQPPQERVVERSEGVYRELEIDVVMDLNVAVGVYAWLEDKINIMAQQQGIAPEVVEGMLSAAKRGTGT